MQTQGDSGGDWHPGVPRFFAEAIRNIPRPYVAILRYLARFDDARGHGFRSVINGGFVRDLLTGKQSDDLDISWDLRRCTKAPNVTIADILESLVEYSQCPPVGDVDGSGGCCGGGSRGGGAGLFGIREVSLVEILGDAEKGKTVDVVKAVFAFEPGVVAVAAAAAGGEGGSNSVVVDVMPVLNRRGKSPPGTAPLADAFRRDLTINALLMEVGLPASGGDSSSLLTELLDLRRRGKLLDECAEDDHDDAGAGGGGNGGSGPDPTATPHTRHDEEEGGNEEAVGGDSSPSFPYEPRSCVLCHGLRWTLLDYVGGVEDLLSTRVLRPPPVALARRGETLDCVLRRHWASRVVSDADRRATAVQLAHHLHLRFPQLFSSVSSASETRRLVLASEETAEYARSFLDWVSTFVADPSRVLRALRFRAKFAGFDFPPSGVFWDALSCAGPQLQRLAGSRVYTNLVKVAGYAFPQVLQLLHALFNSPFAVWTANGGGGGAEDEMVGGEAGRGVEMRLADYVCRCFAAANAGKPPRRRPTRIRSFNPLRCGAVLRALFAPGSPAAPGPAGAARFWGVGASAPGSGSGTNEVPAAAAGGAPAVAPVAELAAAGEDVALAVHFAVALLCCEFDGDDGGGGGGGSGGGGSSRWGGALAVRWDTYAVALEAPSRFAKFGRMVLERSATLLEALHRVDALARSGGSSDSGNCSGDGDGATAPGKSHAVAEEVAGVSSSLNSFLDGVDDVFARVLGVPRWQFQLRVTVWSQFRLDKVAVAAETTWMLARDAAAARAAAASGSGTGGSTDGGVKDGVRAVDGADAAGGTGGAGGGGGGAEAAGAEGKPGGHITTTNNNKKKKKHKAPNQKREKSKKQKEVATAAILELGEQFRNLARVCFEVARHSGAAATPLALAQLTACLDELLDVAPCVAGTAFGVVTGAGIATTTAAATAGKTTLGDRCPFVPLVNGAVVARSALFRAAAPWLRADLMDRLNVFVRMMARRHPGRDGGGGAGAGAGGGGGGGGGGGEGWTDGALSAVFGGPAAPAEIVRLLGGIERRAFENRNKVLRNKRPS